TTLKRVDRISERYISLCALPDRTLLGFAKTDGKCQLDVIKGVNIERTLDVPNCVLMDGAHIYPISTSELYIARSGWIVRYQIVDRDLRELGRIALEDNAKIMDASGRDQSIAQGGRVIVPVGRALHVYEPDKPTLTYRGAPR